MSGRLTDEVVLVTGAARGIGRAIALKAAEEGAVVALLDVLADRLDETTEEWDSVFDVDLKGAWLMAREVLPPMIEARHGAIVNIASIHSSLTTAGMFPYAAAKSGLVGMTRSLALDVAPHNVRVNAVSPGYIGTDLLEEFFDTIPGEHEKALTVHPLGRIGTPEVVCFLALPSRRLRHRRQLVRRRRPRHPLRLTAVE